MHNDFLIYNGQIINGLESDKPMEILDLYDENGKYLIQKTSKEKGNRYSTTGGHVTHNEDGFETIIRELTEEIGEPVEVSNLYDVEENFFEYKEEKFHEYMFLYLAKLKENSNLKYEKFFDGVEKKKHLKFTWFNKEELDEYDVVPIEIKDILKEIIDTNEQDVVKSKIRR